MSLIDPDATQRGQPAWRLALLYPPQGSWTEEDYFALDAGRLVEFDQGCVEVLDMPTKDHQRLVQLIYRILFAHVANNVLGEVFVAPLPVRLWNEKFREPDVLFLASERGEYKGYPDGADLVVEVVSEDVNSRRRDTVDKVREYALAGIPEYWIVDLPARSVQIGVLGDDGYRFATYQPDQAVQSHLLPNLHLNVSELFAS